MDCRLKCYNGDLKIAYLISFLGPYLWRAEVGGGNTQSQLISMAMAEATKLFDKSGGKVTGDKQEML